MKLKVINEFENLFGFDYSLFCSPGRINIIGEHTDYNHGFVLPAAIDRFIYIAIKPNNLKLYRFHSINFGQSLEISVDNLVQSKLSWANYLIGVIHQFIENGIEIPGFDCVIGGDIPIGAGMSSSAAIETCLAFALNDLFQISYDKIKLAQISQKAEHEFAGVNCGIMDQFATLFGNDNQAVKLDCNDLSFEYIDFNSKNHNLVLINSGVKHELASTKYNQRRMECIEGVTIIKKHHQNINSLRDISKELLEKHKEEIPAIVYKRCIYVIKENQRVLNAAQAINEGDFVKLGKLMTESHYGLKNEFEVSCQELDTLVNIAEKSNYVLGSRLMGGGFGGCTINLIETKNFDKFRDIVLKEYKCPDNKSPEIYNLKITEGTHKIKISS